MHNKKHALSPILLALLIASTHSQAATKSISEEVFIEQGDTGFWQVEVMCENTENTFLLQKKTDSEQWCLSNSLNACFESKLIAAQKNCPDSAPQTQNSDTVRSPSKAALAIRDQNEEDDEFDDEFLYDYNKIRKEKTALEDRLIEIQQEKLTLRQREVELQKQQLNAN